MLLTMAAVVMMGQNTYSYVYKNTHETLREKKVRMFHLRNILFIHLPFSVLHVNDNSVKIENYSIDYFVLEKKRAILLFVGNVLRKLNSNDIAPKTSTLFQTVTQNLCS